MDGVGSFAASVSVVEDLPQPVEGNMQDTERIPFLSLSLKHSDSLINHTIKEQFE